MESRLSRVVAICLAVACASAAPQLARAQTSDPLVRLLVAKGVISASDAASLAGPGGQVSRDALIKLLEAKGVISEADAAGLGAPAAGVQVETQPPPAAEIPVYASADNPTTLHAGPVAVTLGGFIDLQTIYRTRSDGAVGTNFFSIPYADTPAGRLSEVRETAQNSQLNLKVETTLPGGGTPIHVTGYFESDFNGFSPTNVEITSNSYSFRLRQAFIDVSRGSWEFLGGQAWSWLTANRTGVGSYPADVFITRDYDLNYNVGLTWARQAVVRVIYHPTSDWALGLSIENPEQFGGFGEITFPFAFPSLATQIDLGAGGTSIPNLTPDFIPKVAYDSQIDGHKLHLEAVGLVSSFRVVTNLPNEPFVGHTAVGYGGSLAGNLELTPGLTGFLSLYASRGGGRYIFGLAPDIVVLPTATGTNVRISPVTSYATVAGLEWQATHKLLLSGYYGLMYASNNFALDTSPGAPPNTYVGFGGPGSSNAENKDIWEASLDASYAIWASPQWGSLLGGVQLSAVERRPWFVAPGAPRSASLGMAWFDLRYLLP